MSQQIDDMWITYFRNHGYPQVTGIAAGMEGTVYSLIPGELIAKVWAPTRSEPELRRLQKFYKRLTSVPSPIHTPELIELEVVDGTLISKERFLLGTPLQDHLTDNARHIDKHALDAIIAVLKFLRSIHPFEEGKLLSVLNEATPFWFNATTWSESVQALISRRIEKFGDQLQSEIPDLATMIESIHAFLNTRNSVQMGIIHGDLCGANIMVDSKSRPLSVLDFGFLSHNWRSSFRCQH